MQRPVARHVHLTATAAATAAVPSTSSPARQQHRRLGVVPPPLPSQALSVLCSLGMVITSASHWPFQQGLPWQMQSLSSSDFGQAVASVGTSAPQVKYGFEVFVPLSLGIQTTDIVMERKHRKTSHSRHASTLSANSRQCTGTRASQVLTADTQATPSTPEWSLRPQPNHITHRLVARQVPDSLGSGSASVVARYPLTNQGIASCGKQKPSNHTTATPCQSLTSISRLSQSGRPPFDASTSSA